VSSFGAVLIAGAAGRFGDDADGVRAVGIGAGAPPTAVTNGSSAAITSSADPGRFAGDFSRSFNNTRSTPRGSCDRTSSGSGGGAAVHWRLSSSRGDSDANGGAPASIS
jgi:hypothetical protein